MLETKDLLKKYKPKKGETVTAVDRISLRFPEKGMVFLLGKSGSGKSTMLNLLGGLDSYDDGEIIIKGISSKDFDQQRFDSYRNTYVGFIFQEYNVLDEFSVGANIALALELQGKKATDEEINRILHEVDLDGFGDRNPNELSGGQKQRVAIARALVKNPEIIMGDEPTGALDSNTGRQVFDTLKKLSADKLVIIVSHDRDYAEQYADRIIELADGKVIRDVTVSEKESDTENGLVFRSNTVEIPGGYHLTEEDRVRINEYIDRVGSGITMTVPDSSRNFRDTDESTIPVQDGKDFRLIKSVLPMKSAFKIGRSSLKHKKFRLVMTILLSVIAFTLFAFVDTFSSYDNVRTTVDSLQDSDIGYLSVSKSVKRGEGIFGALDVWWDSSSTRISDEDLDKIEADTGIPMVGIFKSKTKDFGFTGNIGAVGESEEDAYRMNNHLTSFCGFAEITEESIKKMGYSLYSGRLPDGKKKEIAISLFAAETFTEAGYINAQPVKEETGGRPGSRDFAGEMEKKKKVKPEKFSDPMYMVGKTLLLDNELYTVTGIIDTKFDPSRYEMLAQDTEKFSNAEMVLYYIMSNEYDYAVSDSLTGAAMTGTGVVEKMVNDEPAVNEAVNGNFYIGSYKNEVSFDIYSRFISKLSDIPAGDIIWADKPVESLKENEIIISLGNASTYSGMRSSGFVPESGEITADDLKKLNDFISESGGVEGHLWFYNNDFDSDDDGEIKDIKVVGCFTSDSIYNYADTMVVTDEFADRLCEITEGTYSCAVGPMPESRDEMQKIVEYCSVDGDDVKVRYEMNNAVVYELDTFNGIIKTLAKVFFWVGLFFAVFASILMANFIAVSISYKKHEIGILRAIGSRSNDVFRIFFSESFIIAMIEFVFTCIFCFAGVTILNWFVRHEAGVLITLLHFGIRQVFLILVISVGVAALASFFPVRKTAAKKPIDAIRDR